jgi:hypothetical protein
VNSRERRSENGREVTENQAETRSLGRREDFVPSHIDTAPTPPLKVSKQPKHTKIKLIIFIFRLRMGSRCF